MAEKSDPFGDRLRHEARIRGQIAKLLAIYDRHPETEEGKSARRKAVDLSRKHKIELEGVSMAAPKRFNPGAFAAFGGAIKKQFPGQIDESDLAKPRNRTVDKEDDSNGDPWDY